MAFLSSRRFAAVGLMVGLVSVGLAAQQARTAAGQKDDDFLKGVYLVKDTPGIQVPEIRKAVQPKYTSEAMRAKIQGSVEVQAVINDLGIVDRARVLTSLDKVYGLDEQALAAIKQWTFSAATLNGRRIPVAMTVNLEFRLH